MNETNAFPASHETGQDPFLLHLMEVQQLCHDGHATRQGSNPYLPSEQRIGDVLFDLQKTVLRNLTKIGAAQFAKITNLLEDLLGWLDPLHLKANFFMLESIGDSLEELAAHDDRPDLIPFQLRIGNWRTVLQSRANVNAVLN